MAEITWTAEAQLWLEDIFEYIAADNPGAAIRTVQGIYERAQVLATFPEIGYRHLPSLRNVRVLLYARGRICISWTPVGLAVKLPAASRDALMKRHGATYLRYFPRGPVKKDYVVLPEALLNQTRALRKWAKASLEYVLLQPPRRKARKQSGGRAGRHSARRHAG